MLISTTDTLPPNTEVCGIVHAFDLQALSALAGFATNIASLFGSSKAPAVIDNAYEATKTKALAKLETAATKIGGEAIVGVRMQLVDLGISGGRDSMLGCNVSGTAVRFARKAASPAKIENEGGRRESGARAAANRARGPRTEASSKIHRSSRAAAARWRRQTTPTRRRRRTRGG